LFLQEIPCVPQEFSGFEIMRFPVVAPLKPTKNDPCRKKTEREKAGARQQGALKG
jgi:hypothetical protein